MVMVMVLKNYDDDINDEPFVIIRKLQQSVLLVNFLCVVGMSLVAGVSHCLMHNCDTNGQAIHSA